MGAFKDLEYEFIERTLNLITQYESLLHNYPFEEQYNYTLLINCLTGLIVMPKERTIDAIPGDRLLSSVKKDMGLVYSFVDPRYTTLRDLILKLRNSVAHFYIEVKSDPDGVIIDEIIFYDEYKVPRHDVAIFKAAELWPFIRYYADWLRSNLACKRNVKERLRKG